MVVFTCAHYTLNPAGELVLVGGATKLTRDEARQRDEDAHHELARYVEASLVEDFGFVPINPLPIDDDGVPEPTTTILASNGWNEKAQLIIMCVNQSGSQMGIFSRSLCFDKGLQKGTMLPYVKRALECNYGVLILRPNTNSVAVPDETGKQTKVYIRGSESPEEHALCVWSNVVPQAKEHCQKITLFGYGNGASLCHDLYLKSVIEAEKDQMRSLVSCIVTIEASHVVERDDPRDIKNAMRNICINFESSATSPRGYDLQYRRNRLGCASLSLGLEAGETEVRNVAVSAFNALEDVFGFIQLASDMTFDAQTPHPQLTGLLTPAGSVWAKKTAAGVGAPSGTWQNSLTRMKTFENPDKQVKYETEVNTALVEAYFKRFATKNRITDMKAALVVANPDPLEEPEETGAAASPSEPDAEAEAPKKGIFGFLFGASPPSAKASPKAGDSEQSLCVDDFELLKIVGKGAFGKVMLVRKKAGFNAGKIYAMKVLKKSEVIEKGQVEHTKAEQAILVSIRHPYISCLRFSFQNSDKLYLITDYMSGGNLFAHLRKSKMFDENRAKFYAAELILALDHLHQHEIIYRDLKLENILMDGAGHICLTDFGLSKQDSKNGASTFCGTAEYLAPELLKSETYGIEVDWWSFGILLYEMMNGRSPFYDRNRKMMYNRIMNRPPQFAPNIFSHDAATCIQGLLTVDKKQRLGAGPNGAKAIMTTNFFACIDFDKLFRKELEPPFKPQGDGVVSTEYVPQEFKAMDARRDSSAKAQPVSDPKLAQEMAVAFDGFSFSEETLKNKQG